MQQSKDTLIPPTNIPEEYQTGQHIHTTYDSFGDVVADYTFYPCTQVLYVRWFGHVTSDELVRAAHTGLRINQNLKPRGLFQDTRRSSGDWGEAISWLEYVWIPGIKAKCTNLRGIAILLNPDLAVPYTNTQVLAQLDQEFKFQKFYSPTSAWKWMDELLKHQS